jgi:capsular polysaccharide transport system permease protein
MGAANTDAHAVVQHLQSAEAILAVGRHADVRRILGSAEADALARLDPGAPLEKALRVWRRQVRPYYDRTSGIITVDVRAFSPQDVLALAMGIERAAEELVNAMSERSRAAVLAAATGEAAAAEARLLAARDALLRFREARQVVDPRREVEGLGDLLLRLRIERLGAAAMLERQREVMHPNAQPLVTLRSQIASLDAQIAAVQAQLLAGGGGTAASGLVGTMEGFSTIETEAQMALRVWEGAMTGLEAARVDAARQRIFLAPVVRPVAPEFPTHPDRIANVLTAAAGLGLAWFVGLIAIGALREHLP